jgi:hypothetical protein
MKGEVKNQANLVVKYEFTGPDCDKMIVLELDPDLPIDLCPFAFHPERGSTTKLT